MRIIWMFPAIILINLCADFALAQDLASLRAGVVRIRAQQPKRTGTGFVISVTADRVEILTVSHVVEGDPEPTVEFFTDQGKRVQAEVSKQEADDPRGLAVLRVAKRFVPDGVIALPLSNARVPDGTDVKVIGFPMGGADWALISASVSGPAGRDIALDGTIREGNSGGPVFKGGAVVAIVTQTTDFARATPSPTIVDLLKNWGIKSSAAATVGTGTPSGGEFRITEMTLRAEPTDYKGKCPGKISFSGKISAVGGTSVVSYRFIRSDGVQGPLQSLRFAGAGTQEVQTSWTIGRPDSTRLYSGWQAIKILEPKEMESEKAEFKVQCDAVDEAGAHPDTCIQGYVWREAFPGDHVCVTPNVRSQAAYDNSQAAARKQFGGGAYGPDTCRLGFVWREASPEDHVCVKPEIRARTLRENETASTRVLKAQPGR